MKTERRHELQTNELADWIGKGVEAVEDNYKAALGIAVAALVCVGAYLYLKSESAGKRVQGWDRYFQAQQTNDPLEMQNVAESFEGTPAGAWARLAVADNQLVVGSDELFTQRAEATEQLRKSANNYEQVAQSSVAAKEPLLEQRALWGEGRAYESLNELDKAIAAYSQLTDVKRWPNPVFEAQASRRLDSLRLADTKKFYDWFARQEPAPPPGTTPPPTADLEALPDESQFKSMPAASGTPPVATEATPTVPESTTPESATPDSGANTTPPPAGETPAPPSAETPAAPPQSEATP